MVLLHELGHVRRWDNLVNLLQRVIESLLFYHPAVWWVSRWARLERECCSDQLVLAHTAQPTGYAALLVMMATAGPYTGPRAAAALAETNLLTRTRRILNLEAPIMILSRKSLLLTLTLLLGSLALAVYAQQTGRAKADDQQLYPFWEKGNWGYIDKTGKVAIEPRQKLAWLFRDGRAAFRVAGKWGFLDTAGRIAIKPQFDEFLSFAEGFAAVRVGKQWAFVDRDGQRSAPRFEQARSFSQGLAPVKIGGQWGYVDAKLETIIKPRFQDAWGFTEGLAPVRVNRRWGFIDQTGKMVIEPRFYWVDNFSEGLAIAQGEGDDGGYVDKTGKLAIKQRFWDALPFSEGRAAVVLKPGGMYGLIDRSGKVVVEPAYDEIYPFSEGLAAVRIPAKENPPWGYIDVNGKLVIPAAYSNAETFSGGLAQVRNDRDTAYIDRNGTTVWKSKPVPESEADEEDEDKLPADDALVFASRIEGTAKPAREVSVLSSPQRGRYPDNTDKTLSRSVWDMIVYEGRIYLGGGDYWSNTGPVDIYSLVPGQSEFTKEFTVDEEMVSRFVIADGKLIVPGNDPRESWDLGNLYIKEAGKWAKLRTIPNGVLCFEMAAAKGILYAGVGTDHGQAVLYSRDWGHSWSPVLFQEAPGVLVSDGEAVHGFAFRGGMCTLEGDVLVPEAMVPRSMKRTWFLGEPHDFFFHEPDRPSNAVAFGGGIVTWTWFSSLKYGPDPARFVAPGAARGSVIEALKDARICDVAVDNGRLYALGVREQGKGFALTIYSTADVKTWRPEVTFESAETFPRSFVKAGDAFYVGLGAGVNNEDKDKVPPSTGDILRVVP